MPPLLLPTWRWKEFHRPSSSASALSSPCENIANFEIQSVAFKYSTVSKMLIAFMIVWNFESHMTFCVDLL